MWHWLKSGFAHWAVAGTCTNSFVTSVGSPKAYLPAERRTDDNKGLLLNRIGTLLPRARSGQGKERLFGSRKKLLGRVSIRPPERHSKRGSVGFGTAGGVGKKASPSAFKTRVRNLPEEFGELRSVVKLDAFSSRPGRAQAGHGGASEALITAGERKFVPRRARWSHFTL